MKLYINTYYIQYGSFTVSTLYFLSSAGTLKSGLTRKKTKLSKQQEGKRISKQMNKPVTIENIVQTLSTYFIDREHSS